MKRLFTMGLCLTALWLQAQDQSPYGGIAPSHPKMIALKNATIYLSPDRKIERGTLLISDGKIIKSGALVLIPDQALVLDYTGKTILPAFIELNSAFGMPKLNSKRESGPQYESSKAGPYYWNEAVHPEIEAATLFEYDNKAADEFHQKGFLVVNTHQSDGIAQGSSSVYLLGCEDQRKSLVKDHSGAFFSFRKGVSGQAYPSSQMGSIALLRQAFYDAIWYAKNESKTPNLSLDALSKQKSGPLYFHSEDKLELMRAEAIAKEFQINFIYLGSGNEYQLGDLLKDIKSPIVAPLNFPAAFEINDPYISREISLSELKHWETAPWNAYQLLQRKVTLALSGNGISANDFWKNLRKLKSCGLSEEEILKALTLTPASLLGIEKQFGTLNEGMSASFVVYDENPLEGESKILESWSAGEKKGFKTKQSIDVRGIYNLAIDNEYLILDITGSMSNPSAKIKKYAPGSQQKTSKKSRLKKLKGHTETPKSDTLNISCSISVKGTDVTVQFNSDDLKWQGSSSLHGKYIAKFGVMEGDALLADGRWVRWSGIRNDAAEKEKKKEKTENAQEPEYSVWYPNMAYGFEERPKAETIVIENVTLWTNEKEGIVANGTIIVERGKITYAGSGNYAVPNNATVIDGKGKHVTSGIIDEHSHIAISRGVNEDGQAISAEVRIGDVLNPDDIDIYRQLAGGVTAAQLLHGSANPIGGQSALIKLKWGHQASDLLIPNAPGFIKFALGENVKQANWGDEYSIRFPQTRMGVEQLYYDAFKRAQNYAALKIKNPDQLHVDLELEALSEILNKKRFITCHSYIQSEINMLMKLADSLRFTLNTFTHILEGYKVADKMKAHGAGASTFSDWWTYKFEVNDAIPQNAALLSKMGIVTAINSDDAEMGRRLNQEAAKAVKYGGATEEEAWKMVSLNPAKLLHLDDRMGSLKKGKDADIVLWSANPLSTDARVELTIVDGEVLFDAKRDIQLQVRNAREKARIINLMQDSNAKGGDKKPYQKSKKGHFHCNTLGEEASESENQH